MSSDSELSMSSTRYERWLDEVDQELEPEHESAARRSA